VTPDRAANPPSGARAVLVYNLCRGGLLIAGIVIGWYAGLHNIPVLLVAAFLTSGLLSWFLLKQQRIQMGMALERTVQRSRARIAERTAAEDAYADAVHAADDATT
jgi:hypothetical protein